MIRRVSTPGLVRAQVRAAEATRLRAIGWSYGRIAGHLGYRSRSSAFKAVRRTLEHTRDRAALAHRVMGWMRLERSLDGFARLMTAGDFQRAIATLDRALAEVEG